YKSFLITGGIGFIGSNVSNYLALKYPDTKIVILDINDYCASIENIDKNLTNIEIVIGDIKDTKLVGNILYKYNVTVVFHFAAQTHVDNSFYNSISFTETNVLGTHLLIETVRKYHMDTNNIKKFIHVSTDECYGSVDDNVKRTEESLLYPTNPYACSKVAAEFMLRAYSVSYKLPIIITRMNNVYGINQHIEKLIGRFIFLLLNGKK